MDAGGARQRARSSGYGVLSDQSTWPDDWPQPEQIEPPFRVETDEQRERWTLSLRAAANMVGSRSIDHVLFTARWLYRSDIPNDAP